MEWGLKNVKFLSPFSFCGDKDGNTLTFHANIQDYDEGFCVVLPRFEEQFLILSLPNKKGENNVVLTKDDCAEEMGSKVSLEWIAPRIKRKWITTTSPISTTTKQG